MHDTKICGRCKIAKPVTDFTSDKRRPSGLSSYCKPCGRAYGRQVQRRNRERGPQVRLEKFCPKCGLTKPAAEFPRSRSTSDGLYGRCKPCASACVKKQYAANSAPRRQSASAYKKRNRAKYRELGRRAYHRDVAKTRARAKQKRQTPAHRQYNASYQLRYQALKKTNGQIEPVDRLKVFQRDQGICHICKQPVSLNDFHVDHVIPLSKNGPHTYDNCKTAHSVCNIRKHNKLMEEL